MDAIEGHMARVEKPCEEEIQKRLVEVFGTGIVDMLKGTDSIVTGDYILYVCFGKIDEGKIMTISERANKKRPSHIEIHTCGAFDEWITFFTELKWNVVVDEMNNKEFPSTWISRTSLSPPADDLETCMYVRLINTINPPKDDLEKNLNFTILNNWYDGDKLKIGNCSVLTNRNRTTRLMNLDFLKTLTTRDKLIAVNTLLGTIHDLPDDNGHDNYNGEKLVTLCIDIANLEEYGIDIILNNIPEQHLDFISWLLKSSKIIHELVV